MSKKLKGILLGAAAVLLAAAVVCAVIFLWPEQTETILPADGEYAPSYQSYNYPHSDAVTIDGVLDEEIWQNKNWYTNTTIDNFEGNKPTLYVTATMDEYGIYIASKSADKYVTNSNNNVTDWSFRIAAGNLEDGENLDYFIYMVDVNGAMETNGLEVERSVQILGTVNSGETQGAVVEMFVPWVALNVDTQSGALPKEFKLYSVYHGFYGSSMEKITIEAVQSNNGTTKDFDRYDANGFISIDRENAVVGNAINGYAKNAGWDVSCEVEGIIQSSYGSEHHRIFFKEYGNDFLIETTIIPVKAIDNDWPKAGISFYTTEGVYHTALLEFHDSNLTEGINGTKTAKNISFITLDNYRSAWNQHMLRDPFENKEAKTQEGIKLTVLKNGEKLWYFINDQYYASEKIDYMNMDVFPGFYTLGCDAIFKDYSCKKITDDETVAYLAERNVYQVNVQVGPGGIVEPSKISIVDGESYELDIITKSGFEVSSILINGVEYIDDARKNAKDGVYTVKNAKGEQNVKVTFEKTTEATLTGMLLEENSNKGIGADVHIYGITNKVLHYEVNASQTKGYKCILPNGKYRITVLADGYQYAEKIVEVNGETTLDFALVLSDFTHSLTVNGTTISSQVQKWDMTKESDGKISSSYALGGKMAPLFFKETGTDFVVSTTINYTTAFTKGQDYYQPDLMGGFVFNNGTSEGWVFAQGSGLVKSGWVHVGNLVNYEMLKYPSKETANLTVAKLGEDVYFYLDGRYVHQDKWTNLCIGFKPNEEVAIGLYSCMDQASDIEYSNYSLQWGADVAEKYIEEHPDGNWNVPNSPFADVLHINGERMVSYLRNWDVSRVREGIVRGSHKLDTRFKPLYFSQTATDFAVEAFFEYDKSEGADQWDLFAGFLFHNGTKEGWTLANCDGIVYTDWKQDKQWVSSLSLLNEGDGDLKVGIVKQGDKVTFYFDDIKVAERSWKSLTGFDANENVAIALLMHYDNTCALKVSDYKLITKTAAINNYVAEHTPKAESYGDTDFAQTVLVNGDKTVTSKIDKWDMSHVAEGYVRGSHSLGTKFSPLYFNQTATDFAVEAFFEYDKSEGADQWDLFAGFNFHNGTQEGWMLANCDGIVYTGWNQDKQWVSNLALLNNGDGDLKVGVVKQGDKVTFYFDDIKVAERSWKTLTGLEADDEVAIGLLMNTDNPSALKVSQYQIYAGAEAAEKYIADHEPKNEKLDDTFAKMVLLDDKTVVSQYDKWDISHLAEGYVRGSHSLGTKFSPLYFNQTATDFAVEAFFEYDKSEGADQWDLFAGFMFNNGTQEGWMLANCDGIVYTGWNQDKQWVSNLALLNNGDGDLKVGVVKQGDKVTFYFDDIKVAERSWKTLTGLEADDEVAIGLLMSTDNPSALKVSQYKVYAGTAAAVQYIYDLGPWTVFGDVNGTGWSTDFPMTKQADGTWLSDEAFTFTVGDTIKCRNGSVEIGDGVGVNYVVAAAGTYRVKLDPSAESITLIASKYITQNLDGGITENADGSISFGTAKEDQDDIKYLLTTEKGTYITAEATFKYRDWFHEGGFALSDGTNTMYFAITTDNGNLIVGYNNTEYAKNYVILQNHLNVKDSLGWNTDSSSNAPIKARIIYDNGIVALYIDQGNGWEQWSKNVLNVATLAGFDNSNGSKLDTTKEMSVGVAYRNLAKGCGYVENFSYSTERFDNWTVFGDINGTCWDKQFAMTKQEDGIWLSVPVYLNTNANLKCINHGNEAYYVGSTTGGNYIAAEAGNYYISLDPTAKIITLIATEDQPEAPAYTSANLTVTENTDGTVNITAPNGVVSGLKYFLTTEASDSLVIEATFQYTDWFYDGGFALSDGTNTLYLGFVAANDNIAIGVNSTRYAAWLESCSPKVSTYWLSNNGSQASRNALIKARLVYNSGTAQLFVWSDSTSSWVKWSDTFRVDGSGTGLTGSHIGLDITKSLHAGIAFAGSDPGDSGRSGQGIVLNCSVNFTEDTDS